MAEETSLRLMHLKDQDSFVCIYLPVVAFLLLADSQSSVDLSMLVLEYCQVEISTAQMQ